MVTSRSQSLREFARKMTEGMRRAAEAMRQFLRRVTCAVLRHKPLKIIDKARLDSVSFVSGGIGTMVHVDVSHVVCQRCGARRHEGRWVR